MINKLKNEKGITLIALVVTIIVILILAFISLSLVLGQDGLFKKASDAGKLQKIKNTQEILEVQALSARANTVLSGENVVDEFLNIIKKDNLITDNDIDEEYGLFITVDGLEFKIEEENNNVKIIYQGEKDKLTPSIQTCIINNTTNSITVETSGRNINSFNYYIKESEEGEYELKGNNTTGEYAYLDLEQDKTYYIKIEAVNNNGTDVKEYTKTTGTVTAGTEEGAIVFSNVTWNPSTHTASISLSTNTDYTIQYKVSGKITTWTAGTTVSGLVHSDTVYARLFDGTNGGSSASLTIEDNDAPNVTLTQGEVTTNSITVTAGATDDKSGIANNVIYSFYIKKKSDANYPTQAAQSGTSTTFIKNELNQKTEYEIKVEVEDVAGNVGRNSISATTGEVITSSGNITFNPSATNWTNGDVTVTASTSITGVIVKISDNINFTNSVAGSTGITLTANGTVYARLEDSYGQANGYETYVVSNIDKNAPTVNITQGTVTNSTIQVNTTATDSESGITNNVTCNYYIKQKTEGDNAYVLKQSNSNTSYTYTGLSSGTTYVVKVTITDVAGNVGEKILEIKTKLLVTSVSLSSNKVTLAGGNAPESTTITATITPSNAENKTLQWTSSNPNVATVDQTGKVTAKNIIGTTTITATSTDGSNKSSSIEINVNKCREYFIKDGDVLTSSIFGTLQFIFEACNNGSNNSQAASSFGSSQNNYTNPLYTNPLLALLYNKTAFDAAQNANVFYNRKVNNYLNIHSELFGSANGYGIILERGNDSIPAGNLILDFSMESGSYTGAWSLTHSICDESTDVLNFDSFPSYESYFGTESKVWHRNAIVNSNIASDYTSGSYSYACTIKKNEIPVIVVCCPSRLSAGEFSGINIRNYYFEY